MLRLLALLILSHWPIIANLRRHWLGAASPRLASPHSPRPARPAAGLRLQPRPDRRRCGGHLRPRPVFRQAVRCPVLSCAPYELFALPALSALTSGCACTALYVYVPSLRKVCSKPLAVVALARVVQREALAVWRHAFSRKYSVASHMERIGGGGGGPPLPPHVLAYQIGLPSARVSRPEVPALRPLCVLY
jgi:hypothetical protein|eukprot:COSAG01_NODE_1115_length_11643_cov_197.836798_15_plen_191_part_00